MRTDCEKVVQNTVKKCVKKCWNSFVEKSGYFEFSHSLADFTHKVMSFTQSFSTWFFGKIPLLNQSFARFPQTSTTITINIIKNN